MGLDANADADTDADSDADTDADTDTDTGTAPPPPLDDGTYTGTITINYTMTVPLLGGNSVCDGPIDFTVDSAANPPISGTYSCDWPILDLWAALWLDTVNGTVTGSEAGGLLLGDIDGDESVGTFVFADPWNGFVSAGPTINGTFNNAHFLVDDYVGWWTASRVP